MTAITHGYYEGEKVIFENGKKQYVSKEYQYYMYLQFHLKLIELHKATAMWCAKTSGILQGGQ